MVEDETRKLYQTALEKELEKVGLSGLIAVLADFRDAQVKTEKRLASMEIHIAERDIRLDSLFQAFPDGDVNAHREWHKIQLEILEEKRKIRRAVTEKTISGLVWLLIVGVGMAIWHEVGNAFSLLIGRK